MYRYVKLRGNAMLFAVLQSTEPFLDSYFEFAPLLPAYLQQNVCTCYVDSICMYVCMYVCMDTMHINVFMYVWTNILCVFDRAFHWFGSLRRRVVTSPSRLSKVRAIT